MIVNKQLELTVDSDEGIETAKITLSDDIISKIKNLSAQCLVLGVESMKISFIDPIIWIDGCDEIVEDLDEVGLNISGYHFWWTASFDGIENVSTEHVEVSEVL
jgi:hypothetical protein